MIDPDTRQALSQDVRRLITGRMTNDAFDDVYYTSYERSEDRAVSAIATFCYGLYSSDLPFPYRLRGRYVVDDETRSVAARSVLFLRSGLEYESPPLPDNLPLRVWAGLAGSLGIPAGIAAVLVCIPLALSGFDDGIIVALAIGGPLLLAGSAALAFGWPRLLSDDWQPYQAAGDLDVWPFIRRQDLADTRQTRHLFAK